MAGCDEGVVHDLIPCLEWQNFYEEEGISLAQSFDFDTSRKRVKNKYFLSVLSTLSESTCENPIDSHGLDSKFKLKKKFQDLLPSPFKLNKSNVVGESSVVELHAKPQVDPRDEVKESYRPRSKKKLKVFDRLSPQNIINPFAPPKRANLIPGVKVARPRNDKSESANKNIKNSKLQQRLQHIRSIVHSKIRGKQYEPQQQQQIQEINSRHLPPSIKSKSIKSSKTNPATKLLKSKLQKRFIKLITIQRQKEEDEDRDDGSMNFRFPNVCLRDPKPLDVIDEEVPESYSVLMGPSKKLERHNSRTISTHQVKLRDKIVQRNRKEGEERARVRTLSSVKLHERVKDPEIHLETNHAKEGIFYEIAGHYDYQREAYVKEAANEDTNLEWLS